MDDKLYAEILKLFESVYVPTEEIGTSRRGSASIMKFPTYIGVGGGGLDTITKAGITSKTDAGGAGGGLFLDTTTNNYIWMGNAAGTYGFQAQLGTSQIELLAGNYIMYIHTTYGFSIYYLSSVIDTLNGTGRTATGWALFKGVCIDDASEFLHTDWAAADGPGVKWKSQISAGGSVQVAADAAGGVYSLISILTTPTVLFGLSKNYLITDQPRLYIRCAFQNIASQRYAVGFCDTVPAGAANSLWYTSDGWAVVLDTAVNGNYLFRAVKAAGVTDVDTAQAVVDNQYHVIEIVPTGVATGMDIYIDGVNKGSQAAANLPNQGTPVRKVCYSDNIGGAVSAILNMDCYIPVANRNPRSTAA